MRFIRKTLQRACSCPSEFLEVVLWSVVADFRCLVERTVRANMSFVLLTFTKGWIMKSIAAARNSERGQVGDCHFGSAWFVEQTWRNSKKCIGQTGRCGGREQLL